MDLNKFKEKRIIVIGDIGLDKYCEGVVERISPEAPIPVLSVKNKYIRLGMAANVANNIVALGGFPILLSVIGSDNSAQDLIKELSNNHIDPLHLKVDPTRPTTTKERFLTKQQQIVRVDNETIEQISDELCQEIMSFLSAHQVDGIVIQDHAKGVISRKLIEHALTLDVPIFVDPNKNHEMELYRGCTIITPNKKEAERLTGIKIRNDNDIDATIRYLEVFVKKAIVTLGDKGIAYIDNSNQLIISPTTAKEVYDVSGAGDTVVSIMALGLTSGFQFSEIVELAK